MTDVKSANVLFLDGKYKEAAEAYYTGASEGDAECAFNYGYCLYRGIGVPEDKALAKSFFVFASERIGEADYNLAVMYLFGIGVGRNYKKAVSYMQKAAERDVIEAQLYLAVAYILGDLFLPDVRFISLIPYHTAEYGGEQLLLEGDAPELSLEEEKRMSAIRLDPAAALEWFRRAAKHPSDYVEEMSKQSKYLYARCFLDGVGTDFDRDRANNLMLVAATEGSADALDYLRTDAPYMLAKLSDGGLLSKIRMLEGLPSGD